MVPQLKGAVLQAEPHCELRLLGKQRQRQKLCGSLGRAQTLCKVTQPLLLTPVSKESGN